MKCSRRHCKQEATGRYRMCADCRQYFRVFGKRRVRDQKNLGLCSYGLCEEPPLEGLAMCRKHLDIHAKLKQTRRQFHKSLSPNAPESVSVI